MTTPVIFGFDIGGTTTKAGLFSEEGSLVHSWSFPTRTEESGAHVLPDLAGQIRIACETYSLTPADVLGIGVAVPGPVLPGGIVNGLVNIGWGVVPAKEMLEELTGITPVCVLNDADAAVLGESRKGSAAGKHNVAMLTLGTGVGGGILVNGELVSGAFGAAGEVGHMVVDPRETIPCSCGNCGCLEQYASATGMTAAWSRALQEKGQTVPDDSSAEALFAAAADGDPVAAGIIAKSAEMLGIALANVAAVTDPELFVIGGGVAEAGEALFTPTRASYRAHAFHPSKETDIVPASLGNNAGVYGAAYAVLSQV